ncbi:MAG TPA: NADH pyrophosphatase zinc ribbon domain-containing protein [Conexibacter sp.]|jgi:hypothetical protein
MPNGRTALHLVPETREQQRPSQWFCGHCGTVTETIPSPTARVCGDCGLGLLLEARADLAPQPDEAFMVIDRALTVQALSVGAEHLLAVPEAEAVNRPVTELLVAAAVETLGAEALATVLLEAAGGADDEPHRVTVRPSNVFGVRMTARIGVCGPPRAALLVLE